MNPRLGRTIADLLRASNEPRADRRDALDRVASFVAGRRAVHAPAHLLFVCTANSRRSHFAQVWAAAAGAYYRVDGVETHSGGTVTSAIDRRTIAALERAGFAVEPAVDASRNPHRRIRYADDRPPIDAYSKRYDDASNPQSDFAAVMTCSEADFACPTIVGAAIRVALPYDDPKAADGTPEEAATYDLRLREIAADMLHLFARVAQR